MDQMKNILESTSSYRTLHPTRTRVLFLYEENFPPFFVSLCMLFVVATEVIFFTHPQKEWSEPSILVKYSALAEGPVQ